MIISTVGLYGHILHKIVSALEENGILDNTIIMFMSDNGGVNNIPVGSTCAPLKGQERRDEDKE